ncbi:MAG: RNA polymerase sigma factor [Candidatus Rifleibacteriota bacterium]
MKNDNHQHKIRFEQAVTLYQGLVYSVIYGITTNHHDAWDLTQEVFIKAWQCENFCTEDFKQKAWLVTVARNEALKKKRSLKTRLLYLLKFCGLEPQTESSELEQAMLKSEQIKRLQELLNDLDEDERQILTLRFAAELSYQQIADEMGIKIGTVMSRLARLKDRLGAGFLEDEA